jgi:acetaldehyde dehydrogenase (acetylating)
LKKPAFRIVVNTPTTLGSIGLTTGLDPSMTLGCGGYGGNITSDNISPRHLLNIKRLAYETSPAPPRRTVQPAAGGTSLPKAPAPPRVPGGIAAEPLARRIDQFLASRGYTPPPSSPQAIVSAKPEAGSGAKDQEVRPAPEARPKSGDARLTTDRAPSIEKPADFVCEDDVRQAVRQGRKIIVGERTIVTPAARDLADAHRVFVQASWPR